jgi:hypothetical protein
VFVGVLVGVGVFVLVGVGVIAVFDGVGVILLVLAPRFALLEVIPIFFHKHIR